MPSSDSSPLNSMFSPLIGPLDSNSFSSEISFLSEGHVNLSFAFLQVSEVCTTSSSINGDTEGEFPTSTPSETHSSLRFPGEQLLFSEPLRDFEPLGGVRTGETLADMVPHKVTRVGETL